MPRFNDCLLLAGAVIITGVAAALSYYNLAHGTYNLVQGTAPQDNLNAFLLGTTIALLCALIAIGIDLQDAVTTRLGALANTSILQCWQGWISLLGWGAFNVTMFQIVLRDPKWASETLHFEVGNNLASTGLLVGVSAMVIIRSKLMKVNNIEWGVEWLYLWSSAQSLSAVNRKRIATKAKWVNKFLPYVNDSTKYPNFYTDIEAHFIGILAGSTVKVKEALEQEMKQLRETYAPAGGPTADSTMNASIQARRYLVSAGLDNLGYVDILSFTDTLPAP